MDKSNKQNIALNKLSTGINNDSINRIFKNMLY